MALSRLSDCHTGQTLHAFTMPLIPWYLIRTSEFPGPERYSLASLRCVVQVYSKQTLITSRDKLYFIS
jgi:hypothetical protein